jgi:hypothetical protein
MRTLSQQQLRALILEVIETKEILESEIKKAVTDCLVKEGGAAGIGLCIKTVKNLQTKNKKLPKKLKRNKQIERFILRMKNVVQHKHGDLILTTGLPKR